jgi:predicted MFS family arabinose efflux permease
MADFAHAITDSAVRQRSAVLSMSFCVAMLIAAEFMPVSLLTPMATDLGASEGMAGQAIAVSGLFAVLASLFITRLCRGMDRRHVLLGLTGVLQMSLVCMALAHDFGVLMLARALLGIVVGGFWSLATATVSRLVPAADVPAALGALYTGNALATTLAAPLGSYLGGLLGWRGVFWLMVPLVTLNLCWQWRSLPAMPAGPTAANLGLRSLWARAHVRVAMPAVMLIFAGAFTSFTYFRPFLESQAHVSLPQLSVLLFVLGVAGFVGTHLASRLLARHLYRLLGLLPLLLALATLALLLTGSVPVWAAICLLLWGGLNAAIPVGWSAWLARTLPDAQEVGGGLLVAAIQLAILLGGALGGALLDHLSIHATFLGGAVLLLLGAALVGRGYRVMPAS